MSQRIRIHKVGSRWYAQRGAVALACRDSHAEVIEALDAMRPTLEPCS